MRLFHKPYKVTLHKTYLTKAQTFAQEVVSTVNYRDSNQTNINKIKADHFISKLGEEAVCAVYKQFAHFVSQPDYHIYQKIAKSWDSDLQINGKSLAVKTQRKTQSRKYGLSWTFQAAKKRRDPILQQANAWVCFVHCNDESPLYECIVYPAYQIKHLPFRDPILAHLKGRKQVVYAEDIFEEGEF